MAVTKNFLPGVNRMKVTGKHGKIPWRAGRRREEGND